MVRSQFIFKDFYYVYSIKWGTSRRILNQGSKYVSYSTQGIICSAFAVGIDQLFP